MVRYKKSFLRYISRLVISTISVFLLSSLFATQPVSAETSILDMNHYIQKFQFYTPTQTYTLNSTQKQKLSVMIPYAITATQKYNAAHHADVEAPLVVWWTYAEGIDAEISFSNCNDTVYTISNCYYPASWQLGYGIQFSAIGLLKAAFSSTHGDPSNPELVQQVGQAVLQHDMSKGTKPTCGGYSCTFPRITIDQIMSGVNTNKQTTNNWWASVLSRDPLINSFIDADALTVQNFNRKLAWGWGSYYQTHWQEYSNDLATILKDWSSLGGCPSPSDCTAYTNTYPTPTDKPTPTPEPPPCYKFDTKTGGCSAVYTALGPLLTNPSELVNQIFRLLVSLSGGIATLLIIGSGYQLMASQGNPEKVKAAKERLTSAIVGLIFVIFSIAILQIIGIDILQIPGLSR